jgi:receptor expression-enhancing protein 1/2/3/4
MTFSSVVAFLYPGYASYKTLSQKPASEEDLERWLMYWSVLGCIVGVEYVAEWLVSWLVFR